MSNNSSNHSTESWVTENKIKLIGQPKADVEKIVKNAGFNAWLLHKDMLSIAAYFEKTVRVYFDDAGIVTDIVAG